MSSSPAYAVFNESDVGDRGMCSINKMTTTQRRACRIRRSLGNTFVLGARTPPLAKNMIFLEGKFGLTDNSVI